MKSYKISIRFFKSNKSLVVLRGAHIKPNVLEVSLFKINTCLTFNIPVDLRMSALQFYLLGLEAYTYTHTR
jgi:hypothetical protein